MSVTCQTGMNVMSRSGKNLSIRALIALLACCGLSAQVVAAESGIKTTYAIGSGGFDFGKTEIIRKPTTGKDGEKIVEETSTSSMNLSFGGESYSSRSIEKMKIGPNGLLSYDADFTENGERTVLEARWHGEVLKVRTRLGEGEEWVGLDFAKDQFDFTTPETPPQKELKKLNKDNKKISLQWLNFYELATATVEINYVGTETIKVGQTSLDCIVIVFENHQMDLQGKIWFATDELGTFLVKEEGRNSDGPFTLTLNRYEKL